MSSDVNKPEKMPNSGGPQEISHDAPQATFFQRREPWARKAAARLLTVTRFPVAQAVAGLGSEPWGDRAELSRSVPGSGSIRVAPRMPQAMPPNPSPAPAPPRPPSHPKLTRSGARLTGSTLVRRGQCAVGNLRMANYGDCALDAVNLTLHPGTAAPEAWGRATADTFGAGPPQPMKSCPRGAFPGLCQEGNVRGVPPGRYTKSMRNAGYALSALRLLRVAPNLAERPQDPWQEVVRPNPKAHNRQMDVGDPLTSDPTHP